VFPWQLSLQHSVAFADFSRKHEINVPNKGDTLATALETDMPYTQNACAVPKKVHTRKDN